MAIARNWERIIRVNCKKLLKSKTVLSSLSLAIFVLFLGFGDQGLHAAVASKTKKHRPVKKGKAAKGKKEGCQSR